MNAITLAAYVIALAVPLLAFFLIRAVDLFKTSSPRTLAICALWGAVGAFGLAYAINDMTIAAIGYDAVVRFTAPVVEEILKALVLIYFIQQPSFRYFVDGAIYGFIVGIAFAVVENFFYISTSSGGVLSLAISRVLSTSLMHAMASALVGISLGLLRRRQGGGSVILPLIGIGVAISVHIVYNNVVNSLGGSALLLVAIGIGVGGSAAIAALIKQGLDDEKQRFSKTLSQQVDVSAGERKAIQQLGGGLIESKLEELSASFGEDNVALIRRMLVTQANIGILKNNLNSALVSDRLRRAWEAEIAERQAEMRQIRGELGLYVMTYIQQLFPTRDEAMWDALLEELAQQDPTLVHTFDVFMRVSQLAEKFSPDELVATAERLGRIDIFRSVSLADLENLSRAVDTVRFAPGQMLFDQGDEGDAMYLIDQGGITIYAVDEQGREQRLRTFGPGSVVGDFAVLDGQPRSARARAERELTALVLSRQMFKTYIQSRPQVILAVLQVLAEKARFTTEAVETSIRAASSIAQGNYAEVMRLTAEPPVDSSSANPAEPAPEVVSTDYSTAVYTTVAKTFSRLATALQGGELSAGETR